MKKTSSSVPKSSIPPIPSPDPEKEDTVKLWYDCKYCKKGHNLLVSKKQVREAHNGLLRVTHSHPCTDDKKRYLNLHIDWDYEIRGLNYLFIHDIGTSKGLAPVVGMKKIQIANLQSVAEMDIVIINRETNYEIVIGKTAHPDEKGYYLLSDGGEVESLVYTDLDELIMAWINHLINYIEQHNPSLDDILEALTIHDSDHYNEHFEEWLVSVGQCSYCQLEIPNRI